MPNSSALVSEYISRLNSVLDYVEKHLDEPLSLAQLSDIAGFSTFHFHRIFTAMMGETPFGFIGRLRLERAARLLCKSSDITITGAALSSGYSSPAAFSRAFKTYFNMTPSDWMKQKSNFGKMESTLYQALRNMRNASGFRFSYDELMKDMTHRRENMKSLQGEIKVQLVEERTVAYVRHIGPFAGDTQLFDKLYNKLYTWAAPRGFVDTDKPEDVIKVIIYHDDPDVTGQDSLRISAGILVPEHTHVSGEIGKLVIPAGQYAVARFIISLEEFSDAWQYVCGVWLPSSGYQTGDGYCYELFNYNPEVRTQGKFDAIIYEPVKPL